MLLILVKSLNINSLKSNSWNSNLVEIAIVEISIYEGEDIIDNYCHYIVDLILFAQYL